MGEKAANPVPRSVRSDAGRATNSDEGERRRHVAFLALSNAPRQIVSQAAPFTTIPPHFIEIRCA
jgi:hypothetical protein